MKIVEIKLKQDLKTIFSKKRAIINMCCAFLLYPIFLLVVGGNITWEARWGIPVTSCIFFMLVFIPTEFLMHTLLDEFYYKTFDVMFLTPNYKKIAVEKVLLSLCMCLFVSVGSVSIYLLLSSTPYFPYYGFPFNLPLLLLFVELSICCAVYSYIILTTIKPEQSESMLKLSGSIMAIEMLLTFLLLLLFYNLDKALTIIISIVVLLVGVNLLRNGFRHAILLGGKKKRYSILLPVHNQLMAFSYHFVLQLKNHLFDSILWIGSIIALFTQLNTDRLIMVILLGYVAVFPVMNFLFPILAEDQREREVEIFRVAKVNKLTHFFCVTIPCFFILVLVVGATTLLNLNLTLPMIFLVILMFWLSAVLAYYLSMRSLSPKKELINRLIHTAATLAMLIGFCLVCISFL
jgi:hypothetical protein